MKTLGKIFAALSVSAAVTVASYASSTKLVAVGDNTYEVTRQASTGFTRNTEKLKAEAQNDAAKYCADHGKQLKIVDVIVDRPFYATGFSSAKIVFMALDAGDPALTAKPVPAPIAGLAAGTADGSTGQTLTGDLYSDLLKLDDLRKKGILTEKEFKAEKKKILDRSR